MGQEMYSYQGKEKFAAARGLKWKDCECIDTIDPNQYTPEERQNMPFTTADSLYKAQVIHTNRNYEPIVDID